MGAAAPHRSLAEREPLLRALLDRLLAADQLGAGTVVERALALGWTLDDVRFSLITPALYEVGERWERGQIGVAGEHLATSVCEWLLFGLAGRAQRPAFAGRRAVVGCSEGELHSIGARIVAHVLAEHGWKVLYLGASTPPDSWSQIVQARHPDVAVLCTTMQPRLEEVGPALRAIKAARSGCRTVVGGQAYWGRPDAVASVEADYVLLDAGALASGLEDGITVG